MSQISVVFADDGTTSDGLSYQISGTITFSTTATSGSLVFNDVGKSSGIKYNMGGLFRFNLGPGVGASPSWSLPSSFSFTNGISSTISFAPYISGTPPISVIGHGIPPQVFVNSSFIFVYDGSNAVTTAANCTLVASNSIGVTTSSVFTTRIALGNHPPSWTNTLISIPQGGTFDLHNRCSDQDVGDVLSFSPLSGYSGGISLAAGTAGIVSVSSTVSTGAYAINTRATDMTGLTADSGNLTLSVTGTTQGFSLQRGANIISTFAPTQAGWTSLLTAATAGDIALIAPGDYSNVGIGVTKAISVRCNPIPPLGSPASSFATVSTISDSVSQSQPYAFDVQGLRVYGRKIAGFNPTDPGNAGISLNGQGNTCSTIGCLIEECGQGAIIGGLFRYAYFVDTTFNDCGSEGGTANCHVIYMGIASPVVYSDTTLSVIGCLFQHTYDWRTIPVALQTAPNLGNWRFNQGHMIKSDAAITIVQGNKFVRGGSTTQHPSLGTDTATVQLDYGGNLNITGNTIEEGPKSAYQVNSNTNGISPSGPYARTSTGGPGFDTRILDSAVLAWNGPIGDFGHPWPVQSTVIAQNTIINNGVSSERLFTRSRLTAYNGPDPSSTSPFLGQLPPAPTIMDNVVITGQGLADANGTTWTATTNTISSTGVICIDAVNENWNLTTVAVGSRNWAPWEFNPPVGHKARTDSLRGAYSSSTGVLNPAWKANAGGAGVPLANATWFKLPNSSVGTQDGISGAPSVVFPDWDPSRPSNTPPNAVGIGPSGKVTSYCGMAVRNSGSWLLTFGGGGGTHGTDTDIGGLSLEADNPVWTSVLPSLRWSSMSSDIASMTSATYYNSSVPATIKFPYYSKAQDGTTGGTPQPVQTGFCLGFFNSLDLLYTPSGIALGENGSGNSNATWRWGTTHFDPFSISNNAGSQIPRSEAISAGNTVPTFLNNTIAIDQDSPWMYVVGNSWIGRWQPSLTVNNHGTWQGLMTFASGTGGMSPCLFDHKRKRLVFLGKPNSSAGAGAGQTFKAWMLDASLPEPSPGAWSPRWSVMPMSDSGDGAWNTISATSIAQIGYQMAICHVWNQNRNLDYYLIFSTQATFYGWTKPLIKIDPVTFSCSYYTVTGTGPVQYPNVNSNTTGEWNRMAYIPNLDIVAYIANKGVFGDGVTKDWNTYVFIPT